MEKKHAFFWSFMAIFTAALLGWCLFGLSKAQPVSLPSITDQEQAAVQQANDAKAAAMQRMLKVSALYAAGYEQDDSHWSVVFSDVTGSTAFDMNSVIVGPGGMRLVQMRRDWFEKQFVDDDDHSQGIYDRTDFLYMINCSAHTKATIGMLTFLDGIQVGSSHVDLGDLRVVNFTPIIKESVMDKVAAYTCSVHQKDQS